MKALNESASKKPTEASDYDHKLLERLFAQAGKEDVEVDETYEERKDGYYYDDEDNTSVKTHTGTGSPEEFIDLFP